MQDARDYPFAKKLTLMNMAVSGTALLLACAAFVAYDVATFRENLARFASSQAEIIGSNVVSALVFDDPDTAANTISTLSANSSVLAAVIYTPTGRPFANFSRDGLRAPVVVPTLAPGELETQWIEEGQLALVRQIVFEGNPVGLVYLRLSQQTLYDRLRRYAGIAGVVLVLSLLAALLVSALFRRSVAEPIRKLAEVAAKVSREASYSARATVTANVEEVAVLVRAFNDMLSQIQERDSALQEAHDELEDRVEERTSELKRAEENLRTLSGRLMQLQDEERRNIARELHDSTGQVLAALTLNLSVLRAETSKLSEGAVKALDESIDMLKDMSRELRTLSHLLHPPLLDVAGLESALRWYVQGFAERSGIETELELPEDLGRLPRDLETAVFRIVQESLTNVHRHAKSETAAVRLVRAEEDLRLEVSDRGKGMPVSDGSRAPIGIGVQGMRERVAQLGGDFAIRSGAGGTTVVAKLPLPEESRSASAASSR